MKKVTETISETRFKCDFCEHTALSRSVIEEHEKQHGCEHKKIRYEFDGLACEFSGLLAICLECGKVLSSIDFEDIEDDQELIRSILDLIKGVE
jgi:transcription elongation factor Elf1